MKHNVIETILGFIVIIVAVTFVTYTIQNNRPDMGGYELYAQFDRIDGITPGSDVRISGIKIGTVAGQSLDPNTYLAQITLLINKEVMIPKDSSAEIVGESLLGNKYIAIVPGADVTMLEEGQRIKFTQSAINIESLIGKFVFGGVDNKSEEKTESNTNGLGL